MFLKNLKNHLFLKNLSFLKFHLNLMNHLFLNFLMNRNYLKCR